MTVTLTPDQQNWLEAQVAAGHFTSIEDAIRIAVADLKAANSEDLDWAKPYLEKARQSVAQGHIMSGDEFLRRTEKNLSNGKRDDAARCHARCRA
jgi:Arc/MetJ-type ribon-helix-helix transcriptional regulator